MGRTLTTRQYAEAIEQYGDDLAKLDRAFTRLCDDMPNAIVDRVNEIPLQEHLSEIIEGFRKLGDTLSRECDVAEEAEDRRRDNPLMSDFRRLGQ